MKFRFSIFTFAFLVGLPFFIQGQTPEDVEKITQNYDKVKLQELQKRFSDEYKKNKAYAINYAKRRNIKTQITYPDGSYAELQSVLSDGTLVYYITHNADASKSTRTNLLNIGGLTGFDLDGQNMIAYVWDGGYPRITHQEYDGAGGNDRISIEDANSEINTGLNYDFHGAHVAGIIAASGVNPSAKGMAPRSHLKSYKWSNDLAEVTEATLNGMLISNHSYGFSTNNMPAIFFGLYISHSRDWDDLHYTAPYYLMVKSAGNNGNTNHNSIPINSNFPQYDKLIARSICKNNLLVANAQDVSVNANGDITSPILINPGSSQGPTDDLRIKPDITGNGTGLYSTYHSSDTAYGTLTGTSMSSPNVAGSLLLLQQHHNTLYNTFMKSATLKGLALHTADDAGMAGPDAIFGWGLLNAKKAAETISSKGVNAIVEEVSLSNGESYSITVNANGIDDVMASISWTDPAGPIIPYINDTSARLVNDLDIVVTQNNTSFFPWRLTGVNTNANDADNSKDNFERVDVINAYGSYTLTISHKGNLDSGSQDFSLIVTGLNNFPSTCNTPQDLSLDNITSTNAQISWYPTLSNPEFGYDYFITSGNTIPNASTTPTGNVEFGAYTANLSSLIPNTDYKVYLRSNCDLNDYSDWSNVLDFTTRCSAFSAPYADNFDDLNWLASPQDKIHDCWIRQNTPENSTFKWIVNTGNTPTPNTGPLDDNSGGGNYIFTEGTGSNFGDKAYLHTPLIDLNTIELPALKFKYHMYGSDIGNLSVEIKEIEVLNFTTVFSISGEQQNTNSNPYIEETIDISAYGGKTIEIRFVAESNGDRCDIAIDDFSIYAVDPCDAINSGNSDRDHDGVADICDLDNDNDGILDIDEGKGIALENVALIATASQSSTAFGDIASKAIDGNTDGIWANGSVTHTDNTTTTEYWEVDLGRIFYIDEIKFYNRTSCCSNRISNVFMLISDTTFPSAPADLSGSLSNANFNFQFKKNESAHDITILVNEFGRYIRLQKSGDNNNDYLSFAELEVYGRNDLDTDDDGIPDLLDLDSDNDGIPDNVEAQRTSTYALPHKIFNSDGIDTAYTNAITPIDSEGDTIPDFIDDDSDNDGISDLEESFSTKPSGIVGANGLFADAELTDDYNFVYGIAHNGSNFTMLDSDNDVPTGADYDYRDIPQLQTFFGTHIISSFAQGSLTPTKTNAYLNIIANNWGVVITRVDGVSSIDTPVEGMIVFDNLDQTFKVNTDGTTTGWRTFEN